MNHIFRGLSLFLFIVFCSCSEVSPDDPSNPTSDFKGRIIFPHAGDIYSYDLPSQKIDLLYERKGRQGPFFSPDAKFFTTNNWPSSNEGVAIWNFERGVVEKEFELPNTLLSDQKGVK